MGLLPGLGDQGTDRHQHPQHQANHEPRTTEPRNRTQPDKQATTDAAPIGVGLLVAAYTQERAAEATLAALTRAGSDTGIGYGDAAVVRRDAEGRVHISETRDMSTKTGAGIGGLIGGVIGILGGPAGIAIGAGAGATLGGLAAHADAGFDQQSLEKLGTALPARTSALVITTSKAFVEAVRDQSAHGENLTIASEIAGVIGDHLAARQDVLLDMVLTEDGVAASKVVSAPNQLAVFNIAATDNAVAAEVGVVTEQGAGVAGVADVSDKPDPATPNPDPPPEAVSR